MNTEENNISLSDYITNPTDSQISKSDGDFSSAKNFWGDADIENDIPTPPVTEKIKTDPPQPQPTVTQSKTCTPERARLSAINALGMIDFTNKLLLTPIANWKLKKAMEKINSNLEELEEVVYADDADLEKEGVRQKRAFERLMKKAEEKMKVIQLSDDEIKNGTKTFEEYSIHTGNSLPPEVMIWFFIASTTGKRAIDLIFD